MRQKLRRLALCTVICLALSPAVGQAARPGGPPGLPRPGSVVQAEGRPELYLVLPGGRVAHIQTVQVLRCLGLQGIPPHVVPPPALREMPRLPLLLRGPEGRIYRVEGSTKRHIQNPEVMRQLGYPMDAPLSVGPRELHCIADGSPL